MLSFWQLWFNFVDAKRVPSMKKEMHRTRSDFRRADTPLKSNSQSASSLSDSNACRNTSQSESFLRDTPAHKSVSKLDSSLLDTTFQRTNSQSDPSLLNSTTEDSAFMQSLQANVADRSYSLVMPVEGALQGTSSGEMIDRQPCVKCRLFSCTCTIEGSTCEVSSYREVCLNCKLYSCICPNVHVKNKNAGFTPTCKKINENKEDLRRNTILRQANRELVVSEGNESSGLSGQIEGGSANLPPVVKAHVPNTCTNIASEDLNSTFTLEESRIVDPRVKARTPVIQHKFCKKDSENSDMQKKFEEQFNALADSPASDVRNPCVVDNHNKDGLNSTFRLEGNPSKSNADSGSITKQTSCVLKDKATENPRRNSAELKLSGSNTVTKDSRACNTVVYQSAIRTEDEENTDPNIRRARIKSDMVTKSSKMLTPDEGQGKSGCVRGLNFEEQSQCTPTKNSSKYNVLYLNMLEGLCLDNFVMSKSNID